MAHRAMQPKPSLAKAALWMAGWLSLMTVIAVADADATLVVPIDFVRVPLTALVGWLVYAERVDLLTVVGTVLILTGNVLNLRRRATVSGDASVVARRA